MNKMYIKNEEIIGELPEILEILFKEVDIEKLIELYNKRGKVNNQGIIYKLIDIHEFRRLAISKYPYYLSTEIDNIYKSIDMYFKNNSSGSIFDFTLNLSKCCLNVENNKPRIIYEKLLKWRMASLSLDQNIFIASMLADSDIKSNYVRRNISWSDTVKTNNPTIHKILNKGMAENHFHLKGSGPHFNLSWISLMNDITDREEAFKNSGIDNNSLGNYTKSFKMIDLIKIAAVIRVWIYNNLNVQDKDSILENNFNSNNALGDILNLKTIDSDRIYLEILDIQEEINILRYDGIIKKSDYFCLNNYTDIYNGEKRLLYLSMKKIFSQKSNTKFINLFYLYIIIKERFRSEIIQNNNIHGFENFEYY